MLQKRILLAEDDPNDVLLFRWALKRCGCEADMEVAVNGQEAIDYLSSPARQKVDLLFLDLKMPRVNGFEVLKWLVQNESRKPSRVIVLSGSNMSSDVEQALRLGAHQYLEKPLAAEALRTVLTEMEGCPEAQSRTAAAHRG